MTRNQRLCAGRLTRSVALLACRRAMFALVAFAIVSAGPAAAHQPGEPLDATRLGILLDRLNVVGSALYIAAHPDDENTALLSYLVDERHLSTAYLSLTRGDGGQNLIGTEQGPALGLVRTQELLAARRIDGAEQYFTRAIDFGYSKSAEEALQVWGREALLEDVVLAIRRQRPDVIVTRFSATVGGHGHHLASAQLALEAFHAAADPAQYPAMLARGLAPWQAKRILWNNWSPELEGRTAASAGLVAVDLGTYNRSLARSYTEIAALSRSQHKSQGFGRAPSRGQRPDYFQLTAGAPLGVAPPALGADLIAGVDTSWGRVSGAARLGSALAAVRDGYDPRNPAAVLPLLLTAHDELHRIAPADATARHWLGVKARELHLAIKSAAGLWMEAVADRPTAVPGSTLSVQTVILERAGTGLTVAGIELDHGTTAGVRKSLLAANVPLATSWDVSVPEVAPSQPYWLASPAPGGLYVVDDPDLRGRPESPPLLVATFELDPGPPFEHPIRFEEPVVYRWTDAVAGERYRDVVAVPAVTVSLGSEVTLFTDGSPRRVTVTVRAQADGQAGTVGLDLPPGFSVAVASQPFTLAKAGDEAKHSFDVVASASAGSGELRAYATVAGARVDVGMVEIDHPHIPIQAYFPPATAKLVRVDLGAARPRIGYIMGPGDKVPDALLAAGYEVTLLDDAAIGDGDLDRFDTIVMGVRAYNVRPRLVQQQPRLLAWVKGGGTLVVQYMTTAGLLLDAIGPYPLTLSHDRVTTEDAAVRFLAPGHPLLTIPNRISDADFAGWVQERGLYFASEWDDHYETVIAAHDPGEEDRAGGLLYTRYGRGVFIYTGYSWFRQLPAGVPGAYRLFANLVAAGHAVP